MTDRERWTVYPLLLLALGISMRDKLAPPPVLRTKDLQCERLEIVSPKGHPRAVIAAMGEKSGIVELLGADGKPKLLLAAGSDQSDRPVIQLLGSDGDARVEMTVLKQEAGSVQLRRSADQTIVALGTDKEGTAGAITTFAGDNLPTVAIGSVAGNGVVSTAGPDNKRLGDLTFATNGAGSVTTYLGDSKQVVLDSHQDAGRVSTITKDGRLQFIITGDEQGLGRAIATDKQGKLYLAVMAGLTLAPATAPAPEADPKAEPSPDKPEGEAPPADE